MHCSHCEKPLSVSDIVWVVTAADEDPDAVCGLCAVQLILSPHVRKALMLEPAPILAGAAR